MTHAFFLSIFTFPLQGRKTGASATGCKILHPGLVTFSHFPIFLFTVEMLLFRCKFDYVQEEEKAFLKD